MPTLCSVQKCTGCGACMAACTHGAITFETDKRGFKYPHIDFSKCVECGRCCKQCPILSNKPMNRPIVAIACFNSDITQRIQSSSGGLAFLLAKDMVHRGGVVYGCAFVPPFEVKHIRCVDEQQVSLLRGSKYVQSDITEVYSLMKADLKAGLHVLFIGTPCQAAAIKSSFPHETNLFVVDIVCHGVPSIDMLKKSLPKYVFNYFIDKMEFRENTKFHFSLCEGNRKFYDRSLGNDMFMKGFFNGVTFRRSCFHCQFARRERITDLTIGDFWGLKSSVIKDAQLGVSLALINTERGRELFKSIKSLMYIERRPIEEAFTENKQLNRPFKKSIRCTIFRCLYPIIGYNAAIWCTLPDKVIAMKIKYYIRKI